MTAARARTFATDHDLHPRSVPAHRFSIGVTDAYATLVGVVMVGRPADTHLDDGHMAEATTVYLDGITGLRTTLLTAAWRTATAMGYRRLITTNDTGQVQLTERPRRRRVSGRHDIRPGAARGGREIVRRLRQSPLPDGEEAGAGP
ncbi:XF1762 family protein [Longispora fulva]|uniref:Uncharacterized protein n=1 Tax=Longispora fulva TaxID=619741 RepID=A0A8J7GGA0_9ACTN|nr:XF1762 family protein [Longispora fulva]MBG6136132.1 hypothetical protein [Longispora fulva]